MTTTTPHNQDRLLSDEELREQVFRFSQANNIGNIMSLINTQKRLYAESVIGEDVNIELVPYDVKYPTPKELEGQFEPMTFLVCNACGWWKDDPESGHFCEVVNEIKAEQRARIK